MESREPEAPVGAEEQQPGYAERVGGETSEPTGGGVGRETAEEPEEQPGGGLADQEPGGFSGEESGSGLSGEESAGGMADDPSAGQSGADLPGEEEGVGPAGEAEEDEGGEMSGEPSY